MVGDSGWLHPLSLILHPCCEGGFLIYDDEFFQKLAMGEKQDTQG